MLARVTAILTGCLCLSACATNQATIQSSQSANATTSTTPEVVLNPERAYLHLNELTPAIAPIEAASSLPPLSERAAKRVAKARSLMNEQRFTQASGELDRALRFDPKHALIHRMMAVLHWEAGNTRRARTHAESAIDQSPDDATAYLVLGQCAIADSDDEAAILAFRTALACPGIHQDPSISLRCQYFIAEALSREGFVQASLDAYNDFERTAEAFGAEMKQGEATTLLRATGGFASVKKSELLAKLGKFDQAAKALARAALAGDADSATIIRYAELLDFAGQTEQAIDIIGNLTQVDEPTVALVTRMFKKLNRNDALIAQLVKFQRQEPDKAHLVLSLANAFGEANRAQESLQSLQDFLKRHTSQAMVRARLVQIYIGQEDWVQALSQSAAGLAFGQPDEGQINNAVKLLINTPASIKALLTAPMTEANEWETLLLVKISLADGQKKRARTLLDQCLQAHENFIPARRLLASMLMNDYQYDEALRAVSRKQDDVPEDAGLEVLLGKINRRLDDNEAAANHFKAALQLDRMNAEAMLLLSRVQVSLGKRLGAQRQLRVLLGQQPTNDEARELLARIYLSDNKPELAEKAFQYIADHGSDEVQRARCQVLANELPEIDPISYRTELLALTDAYPNDASLWLALAETYVPEEDPEPVIELYRKAILADPDSEDAKFGLVVTSQQMLEFEQAIDLLKDLLRRRPNRHRWRLALADLHWTLGDYDAALAIAQPYQDDAEINKHQRRRYRQLVVEILQETKRIDEQLSLMQRWSEEPGGESWLSLLSRSYLINERTKEAIAIREKAFQEDADNRDKLTDLVAALMTDKQYTRAEQYALDWVAEDPDSDGALALLVEVLSETKAYEDVRQLSEEVLLHTFNRQFFQNRLILTLRQDERFHEAAEYIDALTDEVIKLIQARSRQRQPRVKAKQSSRPLPFQPDEPFSLEKLNRRLIQLHTLEATLYMDSKDYDKAINLLEDWLEETKHPDARFRYLVAMGQCYQLSERDSKAMATLEKALMIRPRDVGFNNDVAYGWINKGIRLEEAERMIRYSVSQSPRNRAYLDTYGWLLYKKGEFKAAKKWLMRSLGNAAEADPVVLDHVGDVCWRLGLKKEAIDYWTASRDALAKRDEDLPSTAELIQIGELSDKKIAAARERGQPPVAATGAETEKQNDGVK